MINIFINGEMTDKGKKNLGNFSEFQICRYQVRRCTLIFTSEDYAEQIDIPTSSQEEIEDFLDRTARKAQENHAEVFNPENLEYFNLVIRTDGRENATKPNPGIIQATVINQIVHRTNLLDDKEVS